MSMALAAQARARVWEKWGKHIPAGLKSMTVTDIFRFHTMQASYDIAFASTYVRTFRSANNMGCRAGDKIAPGVAAFVTADAANRDRLIHVAPNALALDPRMTIDDPEALLAHEYIHWLWHPAFYPAY